MKVLITGGAGYLGSALVEELLRSGEHDVTVFDNLSRKNHGLFLQAKLPNTERLHFVNADILDSRRLRRALKDQDVVFHLAARTGTPFSDGDPHGFEQVNHWGSAEVSYGIEESAVRHAIYLSSLSVYGPTTVAVNESAYTAPVTSYGVSKLKGEQFFERLAQGDRRVSIVRCANIFGHSSTMRFDAVINRFLFDAHFKGRVSLQGSGDQFRGFVHVREAASALNWLISSAGESGILNLVSRTQSVNQILETLGELYPGLEVLKVNQQFSMRSIQAAAHPDFEAYLRSRGSSSLLDDMKEIRDSWSF